MKLKSISTVNVMPVRQFHVGDLSDVVVLAGANGVGKTRLLEWLINFFRNLPSNNEQWIEVEATSKAERDAWGKAALDTRVSADANLLRQTLQRKKKRSGQKSSILNFESNRSIAQVKPYAFTWDVGDPYDEEVGWDSGFSFLRDRFTDTLHSIFRKIRSRREAMSFSIEKLMRDSAQPGGSAAENGIIAFDTSKFPDAMLPFKEAFSQLLAPKTLLDPDLKGQSLQFSDGAASYPITALSSGEREVVNIVFDFLLRNPSDCIVIFDEPELHLHPELSYKLIQTLRSVGERNQFIFCTHSADIIAASLENSVVFVAPPREGDGNQAIVVREDDETHQALKLMGQSIGIISLGRRIVLVEGEHGSLDKQTYGAILRNRFPNLVLVPSGGKGIIQSFSTLVDRILSRTVWGVEFFMLCDRDAVPVNLDGLSVGEASKGRLRVLPRYHLENYFLDEKVIADIFSNLEPEGSWLRSPPAIRECLIEIAREQISFATALIVSSTLREKTGNVDLMPKGVQGRSADELAALIETRAKTEMTRVAHTLSSEEIRNLVSGTMKALEDSLSSSNDQWKYAIPGRVILKKFCGKVGLDFGRYKMAYIKAAEVCDPSPFAEIEEIFRGFSL